MNKETFNLRSDEVKFLCLNRIKELKVGENYCVSIQSEKQKRSNDQNSLYWLWIEYLTKSGIGGGWDKDEWHNYLKSKYLRQLLCEQNDDWVDFYNNADLIYQQSEHKEKVKELVISSISTTDLTMKSMSNYLDLVDGFAMSKDVLLPVRDDLAYLKPEVNIKRT